jgi:hypothetical protein
MNVTINSFVVVFGSVARGDSNKNSDLDILLIESDTDKANSILEKQDLPNLPVNYVNYSHDLFKKYYDMGSLFLHHIFEQGVLLSGSELEWSKYKEQFKLKNNFNDEINKIKSDIEVYSDISIFNGMFYSPLANAFPMMKNYCIFTLANAGIFEFNKVKCIEKMKASSNAISDFLLLQSFYDSSVKGLDVDLGVDPCSIEASLLLQKVYSYISKGKI